jgi:hypothetical protein
MSLKTKGPSTVKIVKFFFYILEYCGKSSDNVIEVKGYAFDTGFILKISVFGKLTINPNF